MSKFPLSAQQIAKLVDAPEANVAIHWPLIETHLRALLDASDLACVAAIATIRVECPPFKPRAEQYNGDPQQYFKKYDGRFGNDQPGDGYKYRGRGPIQLTFKDNYELYGRLIGVDLVGNPDAALEPEPAAAIFAQYFFRLHIEQAADAQDWLKVRRLVNGGHNGMQDFSNYISRLRTALAETNRAKAAAAAGGGV